MCKYATTNRLIGTNNDKIIYSNTCNNENNIYIDKVHNKCVKKCAQDLYVYNIFCFYACPRSTESANRTNHIYV